MVEYGCGGRGGRSVVRMAWVRGTGDGRLGRSFFGSVEVWLREWRRMAHQKEEDGLRRFAWQLRESIEVKGFKRER